MLESILKQARKIALPAVILASSFFPSKSRAYDVSFVSLNEKGYIVEIDLGSEKPEIRVNAENGQIAEKAGKLAIVDQEIESLDLDAWRLFKDAKDMFTKPKERAEGTANKINLIERLLKIEDAKIPWQILALESPKKIRAKFAALSKAFEYWRDSLELTKISSNRNLGTDLDADYNDLCSMDGKVRNLLSYIKEINESPEDLVKRDEIYFLLEDFFKTLNIKKLNAKKKEIIKRYHLTAEQIEKIEKSFEKQFKEEFESKSLEKKISEYKIVLTETENIFQGKFNVPLSTSLNPKFQTPKYQENAELEIKIEKMGDNYNLWLLSDKTFNESRTDLFIVQSKDVSLLGKIAQKAYNFKIRDNISTKKWEKIVLKGEDASVEMAFEAVDYSFDRLIGETMAGKIIIITNILNGLGEGIYNFGLNKDRKNPETLVELLNEKYEIHQIKINPVKAFRQAQGYFFSIPLKTSKNSDVLLYMNIGLQSGRIPTEKGYGSGNEEASGRLKEITISLSKRKVENIHKVLEEMPKEIYEKSLVEFLDNEEKRFEKDHPETDYKYRITGCNADEADVYVSQISERKLSNQEFFSKFLNSNPKDLLKQLNSEKIDFSFSLYLQKINNKWQENEKEIKEFLELIRKQIDDCHFNKGIYPEDLAENLESYISPGAYSKIEEKANSLHLTNKEFIYDKSSGKIFYKNHLNW
jgi:hypothetical protein